MGEQQSFLETGLAAADARRDRDARKRLQLLQQFSFKDQRHQGGAGFRQRDAKLLCQPVTEIGCAHFGDRFSSRRHHQRAAFQDFAGRQLQRKAIRGFFDILDLGAQPQLDARLFHLGQQHVDDLARRAIAEQLAQGLFMPVDAVALHQGDEIRSAIAAERRNAEMRIGRKKLRRGGMEIGEIASSAAGDPDLLARRLCGFQHQNLAAALTGHSGAHHACRTRTDDDDIEVHAGLCRSQAQKNRKAA